MLKNCSLILYCIVFILLSSVAIVSAEDKALAPYIARALNNRKDLKVLDEQYKLTELRIMNSARILGPSMTLQYKESDGETETDDYQAKTYNVKVNQTMFTGGKKWYTLKREQSGLDIIDGKMRKTEQDIKFEVIKSYYTALLNREKLNNVSDIIAKVEKESRVAEKKYSAKILTRVDYLEIKNILAEIKIQKEMAAAEYELSLMDLKSKVDETLDGSYELADNCILSKNDDFMEMTLEQYKRMALRNRPEIESLKAVINQSLYTEKVAKADGIPGVNVDFVLGKGGEAYVDQDLTLATEWSVFGNLQWIFWGSTLSGKYGNKKTEPSEILDTSVRTKTTDRIIQLSVLDRLDYYYGRQEKKVTVTQARKDLEDMEKKVLLEVVKNYRSMGINSRTIKMAIDKLELLEKQLSIIEKRTFLGEAEPISFIQALQKRLNGKNALMDAISKYNIGLGALKVSIGMDAFPIRREINE